VTSLKTCFVIAPFGKSGSDIRKRSDKLLIDVISPIASQFGYDILRADMIADPGLITNQIIQHIIHDPLVVADLTGGNPNVYYELAIRHALRKPLIQIVESDEIIPFDISATRAILVKTTTQQGIKDSKKELIRAFKAIEDIDTLLDNPISVALNLFANNEGDEHNPFQGSKVKTYTSRETAYSAIPDIIDNASKDGGTKNLYFAALHGYLGKRLTAPHIPEFNLFDKSIISCIMSSGSEMWSVHELLNVTTKARLERVKKRLETTKDADGYEVRAFSLKDSLPILSPLIIGNHDVLFGLEDPRYNRVSAIIHVESTNSVEIVKSYFLSLWNDPLVYVLRSAVEVQPDEIARLEKYVLKLNDL